MLPKYERDTYQFTPLMYALQQGNVAMARWILDSQLYSDRIRSPEFPINSHLFYAYWGGSEEAVQLVCDSVFANEIDVWCRGPAQIALEYGPQAVFDGISS